METFEIFEQQLRSGLAHLHDPTYQPPNLLFKVTGHQPDEGNKAVQATIQQTIDDFKPVIATQSNARSQRIYKVLFYRYIQGLTQEKTAQKLAITPRHLRREQQQAARSLAQYLWDKYQADRSSSAEHIQADASDPHDSSLTWQSQVREDLSILRQHAPGMMANISEVIEDTLPIAQVLTSKRTINLRVESIPAGLLVPLHPNTLRQILLAAIDKLSQQMLSGEIVLHIEQPDNKIHLLITGQPATAPASLNSEFIQEVLAGQKDATVHIEIENEYVTFRIILSAANKITVAVVDDNEGMFRLYQRYTMTTKYEIIHVPKGEELFALIETRKPDIIVLDVMLPDVDGWELLTHLHAHSLSQSIPVIVCSVVRRESLAYGLGATNYLVKPIRRRQFIGALDQALSRVVATELTN